MPSIAIGTLVVEGFPALDGSVQIILRSARGQQEATISFEEWTSLTQVGALGPNELKRLRGIEKVATVIGEHWRDQQGLNAGLLDLLVDTVSYG